MELMDWTDGKLEERLARIDDRFDGLEAVVAVKSETRELQKELARLSAEVEVLRDEMRREFGSLRTEMTKELRALRSEMKEELRALRGEMVEEFRAVRRELHRDRQILIGALIAAIVAILLKGG